MVQSRGPRHGWRHTHSHTDWRGSAVLCCAQVTMATSRQAVASRHRHKNKQTEYTQGKQYGKEAQEEEEEG